LRAGAPGRARPDAGPPSHRRDLARSSHPPQRPPAGEARDPPLELGPAEPAEARAGRSERSTSPPMAENRYIAVEGAIRVGKTSLWGLVSERFQARLVLEEVEENPFLKDFYRDRVRYAFQTQMHFLFSRFQQQRGLRQLELFHERMVADYLFQKDRIFAGL